MGQDWCDLVEEASAAEALEATNHFNQIDKSAGKSPISLRFA